jgi:DNA-binding HxlR family transcriptional regulator
VIGHRWAVQILWSLHHAARPLRFRELHRSLESITPKELTKRLRELEAAGIIHRRAYAEVPPRVEYRLTESGQTLPPLLVPLASWGKQNGSGLKGQDTADGRKG